MTEEGGGEALRKGGEGGMRQRIHGAHSSSNMAAFNSCSDWQSKQMSGLFTMEVAKLMLVIHIP